MVDIKQSNNENERMKEKIDKLYTPQFTEQFDKIWGQFSQQAKEDQMPIEFGNSVLRGMDSDH